MLIIVQVYEKKNELIVLNSRVVFKQTTITRYFILIWAARKYGNVRALILFKSSYRRDQALIRARLNGPNTRLILSDSNALHLLKN